MQRETVEEQILHDYTRQGRKKIPGITGIRGVAACWVVLFHYFIMSFISPATKYLGSLPVIGRGYLGVDLFFLLSGFVLYISYKNSLSEMNIAKTKTFVISRIFRVYPIHLLALLCFAAIFCLDAKLLLPGQGPYNGRTFMLSALLIQSWVLQPQIWNAPAWSLSDELLAYVMFPVLMIGIYRVRNWRLALLLILGAFAALALLCAITRDPGFDHIIRIGMARCLIEFPAGMLLGKILELKNFSARAGSRFLITGFILLAIAMFSIRLDWLSLPAFSLMIASCATGSPLADRLFANRISHWLGEVSYSIYILHFLFLEVAIQYAATYLPDRTVAGFVLPAIAALAVFPVAYLTWRFIEVPGQALGRELIARRTAAAAHSGQSAPVPVLDGGDRSS